MSSDSPPPGARVPTLPSQTKNPSRIGHKKHRTGCVTCKLRKVKCDEGKPSCQRCITARRVCEGYRLLQGPTVRAPAPTSIPTFRTAAEIRAFEFYQCRSIALLGGITSNREEFWGGMVMQLTHAEPAVKHAVLALSNLHEDVCCGKDRTGSSNAGLAFSEYGKAIAALRSWDMTNKGSETAAIPLLVCVLFVCIEFLLGYDTTAQLHICQGRLILSETDGAPHTTWSTEMIQKILVPIYARLGLACYLFTSQPEPIPAQLAVGGRHMPHTMSSMTEARDMLFSLIDEGLRFTISSKKAAFNPAAYSGEMQRLQTIQAQFLAQLSQWDTAFTCLQSSTISDTISSRAMQDLLYVFYHAAFIWLSTALSSSESAYDQYVSSFAAIVRLASSAIAVPGSLQREDAAFTFETEYLAPVYWTAIKCRNPMLRRAALRLLERDDVKRRRENLWQAQELATIATFIIKVEEGDDQSVADGCRGSVSDANGTWCYPQASQVPSTQPPTIPDLTMENGRTKLWDSITEPTCSIPVNDRVTKHVPVLEDFQAADVTSRTDSSQLQPPFGVPEVNRIKNTSVGPRDSNGVWITTFMDPQPSSMEWTVKTMYLKVRETDQSL